MIHGSLINYSALKKAIETIKRTRSHPTAVMKPKYTGSSPNPSPTRKEAGKQYKSSNIKPLAPMADVAVVGRVTGKKLPIILTTVGWPYTGHIAPIYKVLIILMIVLHVYKIYPQKQPGCKKCKANQEQHQLYCYEQGHQQWWQLGHFALGPQEDQYTLIELSNNLLKQSSHYGEGPTFISCSGPLKFSRQPWL